MTQYFGRYGYNNCVNCGGIQVKRLKQSPENPLVILRKRILFFLQNGSRAKAISLLIHAPVHEDQRKTFYRKYFK
ncbi:MAG: hypothetical protein ACFFG0_01125 [Candidatus Thorarchaeota archaeon]